MAIVLQEVLTKKHLKMFIKFPSKLYRNSKLFVPPLLKEEQNKLDKDKNPAFDFCEAKYWLAFDDGELVGRIAGIINYNYNKTHKINYVRFGWLDFIENDVVLRLLLEKVEQWAVSESMDHVHGPLGFNSFDASGVLVDGFEELPTSFGHYNFNYYSQMIENNGYKKEVDWFEYRLDAPYEIPAQIERGSRLVQAKYDLKRAVLNNKKTLLNYSDELFGILNESYANLFGFSKLSQKQVVGLKKEFISFLNLEYISIVVNNKDEIVAFGIAIPSLANALRKSKGSLFPFGFYHLSKALRKNDTVDLLLIGIKPEYQKKGVHAIIFEQIGEAMIKNNIKYVETNRELEHNYDVQQLWKKFNATHHKTSRCFVKGVG